MIAVLSLTPVRCGKTCCLLLLTELCNITINTTASHATPLSRRRSPVNPVTNVFPLVVVLTVSMVKEAAEDNKRRKKDAQVCAVSTTLLIFTLSHHLLSLLRPAAALLRAAV